MAVEVNRPSYVKTAEEVLELGIREIPMLLTPLLPKKGVAFLCGSSDVGKSFFLLYLALCICGQDEDIFGFRINRIYGSVIVVCTEEGMEEICVRLTSLSEGRDIEMNKLRFIFETEDLVGKLRNELEREPADLVIIDTFGDLYQGNLNESIGIRQYLKRFKQMATTSGCLFLFNHHIGKGKEKNSSPSKNDILGSQGIESAARVVLDLRKIDQDNRVLTVVKGNHIPEEVKNKGIKLGFNTVRGFFKIEGNTNDQPAISETGEGTLESQEERVMFYYSKYKSCRKAAEELTKDGFPMGKTKVSEIVKNHRPSVQHLEKIE